MSTILGLNVWRSPDFDATPCKLALRYFMWVVGNQGDPTGVSYGDEIFYYFL
jgi:hypothetical protein